VKKPRVHVTDHAVIRHLERVLQIDVEAHRTEIARLVERGAEMGAQGVVVDGYSYKLRDGVVTTVVKVSEPDKRTGRCDHRRRG